MNEGEQKNGSDTLAKLLNKLNLPTLAMIMLMGGGNIWATKTISDDQRQDIFRAIKQVHELHDALEEFEKRQKTMLNSQTDILRNQTQMLSNQTRMLEQIKQ